VDSEVDKTQNLYPLGVFKKEILVGKSKNAAATALRCAQKASKQGGGKKSREKERERLLSPLLLGGGEEGKIVLGVTPQGARAVKARILTLKGAEGVSRGSFLVKLPGVEGWGGSRVLQLGGGIRRRRKKNGMKKQENGKKMG